MRPDVTAAAPDPESARYFLARLRQDAPAAYRSLMAMPHAQRCAVALFSFSRFLSESVLRNPQRLLDVSAAADFNGMLSLEQYRERLFAFLGAGIPSAVDFARFRRHQLLRILLRDVLGAATLANVTEELSNLADAILDVAYRRIRAELVARHGEPRLDDGSLCGFSVISLGKLGGKELNYSSDIDLMFVYGGVGETDGPGVLTNKEFYKKVANQYTSLLSSYTAEGQCYRVDLRLRPDGTLGEIAVSEEGARIYYSDRARDWEKQMLIKARISAGENAPGAALLEFVEPLIYQSSLDFRAVEAVSETRQRISEKLAAKRAPHGGIDVKLTPGGIRDIEFLVQCLQRLHGGREQWVRHGGTVFALFRLRDKGFLSDGEYARLSAAYTFLRNLEHRLQMEEDRQTHTLPKDAVRLTLLARKMPPDASRAPLDAEALQRRLHDHLAAVREIYQRVVNDYQPPATLPEAPVAAPEETESVSAGNTIDRVVLDQLRDRAPRLTAALETFPLRRGRARMEHLLEEIAGSPDLLARLDATPAGVLDIFENSAHFADQLLRYPELLHEVGEPFQLEGGLLQDGAALRRFYRRQMLRIQCESMLDRAPIFETLGKTSVLADTVIAAAYRIALAESPPPGPGYSPSGQMMVICLGRLGMREFDLGSDADVNFVIPDEDAPQLVYWTGVAERMIQTLSSYTGEGVMFAIDTRLKPDGRAGDLVQTEGAYKTYFADKAEAWEGIAYMKSRALAGNIDRATVFLNELQDVDWLRYGQSKRSRHELGEMRARLEREQGSRNPLKAGAGGYYDIDFALMYLRLRGAEVFYKVLNTPARIEVIEKMGHLSPEDANFLRDASTFYRALDHAQRLSLGRAEGTLPTGKAQLEVLTGLIKRWTPAHLHRYPLDLTLARIRRRTREFFDRLFGGD
ncbi:MAG: glutamine-synthetase adenylyltransferase [Candidatus Solibacter sp.]